MSATELYKPVTSGGILNTNFFNGRLLTAEDMTALQIANAHQHQQLGRALGEGVAYGLEISLARTSAARKPVVSVSQGLAFNRKGEAVALTADVDVALVKGPEMSPAETGIFAECQPPQPAPLLTNLGLYVLTVMPASELQGRVLMTELSTDGRGTRCGSRFAAEGVKFGFVRIEVGSATDPATLRGQIAQLATQLDGQLAQLANLSGSAANQFALQIAPGLSKFRNLVAHLCFGSETLAKFSRDIFPRPNVAPFLAGYSVIDELRDAGFLTDCEVPLALVYWTSSGLVYLDTWAVRRPVVSPAAAEQWGPLASPRRLAEGLSMFLHFQNHIAELQTRLPAGVLASVKATDYFRYLPPFGFLPLAGVQGSTGFDYLRFFQGRTLRNPVFIEGSREESLLLRSLTFPPIDFANQEMHWLYLARENMEAIERNRTPLPQPYLIFSNGQMRFEGQAYFDLNYWNYANYV